MVILDNKKRTDDGPNQHDGPSRNRELFMGSDEEDIDGMEQESNFEDPKNVFMEGFNTDVCQTL